MNSCPKIVCILHYSFQKINQKASSSMQRQEVLHIEADNFWFFTAFSTKISALFQLNP